MICSVISKQVQVCLSMHPHEMLMMMGNRKVFYDRQMRGRKGQPHRPKKPKRLKYPKSFDDLVKDPLEELYPFVEAISGLPSDQKSKHYLQGIERDSFAKHGRKQREYLHGYHDHERGYDIQQPRLTPLQKAISDSRFRTLGEVIRQAEKVFDGQVERIGKNKKVFKERLSNYGIYVNLPSESDDRQRWDKVKKVLIRKVKGVQQKYEHIMNSILNFPFIQANIHKLMEGDKWLRKYRNLGGEQLTCVIQLISHYLNIPSQDFLLAGATRISNRVDSVMRRQGEQSMQVNMIVESVKSKQCSFYWKQIMYSTSQISPCHHPKDLNRSHFNDRQAEYVGLITKDTLKKLDHGYWLDSTITDAVLCYIRNIQGANNDHHDDKKEVFIFNHTQTDNYINSNRFINQRPLQYQKMVFLVNIPNTHWFVVVLFNEKKLAVIYDSMRSYENQAREKVAQILRVNKASSGYAVKYISSPSQNNTSDCGVFALINVICAVDKRKQKNDYIYENRYDSWIIPQIRYSLYIFLLYLCHCKKHVVVPRKDYFDVLFRSTIHDRMETKHGSGRMNL